MADTRVKYAMGKAVPGFQAGQGRTNQTKQTLFKAGQYDWKIHATIETFDTVGAGKDAQRAVKKFHVSLYSDGIRWGGFYWTHSNGTFACSGYEGKDKKQFGDDKALATILSRSGAVAAALKTTFGGTIAQAKW